MIYIIYFITIVILSAVIMYFSKVDKNPKSHKIKKNKY